MGLLLVMAGFHHAAPNSKRRNEDAPQESHDTDEQQKVLLIGLGILLNKGGILWLEQFFICFWYDRFDACWIHGDTLERRGKVSDFVPSNATI